MKTLISLLTFLLITGCATNPIAYKDARPVSTEYLLKGYHEYSQQKDGAVRVIVVRDSGIISGAVELSINGVPVAKFMSSESIELYLKPGDYIFAIERSVFLLPRTVYEKEVQITSGKSYAFRIFLENRMGFVTLSLMPSSMLQ